MTRYTMRYSVRRTSVVTQGKASFNIKEYNKLVSSFYSLISMVHWKRIVREPKKRCKFLRTKEERDNKDDLTVEQKKQIYFHEVAMICLQGMLNQNKSKHLFQVSRQTLQLIYTFAIGLCAIVANQNCEPLIDIEKRMSYRSTFCRVSASDINTSSVMAGDDEDAARNNRSMNRQMENVYNKLKFVSWEEYRKNFDTNVLNDHAKTEKPRSFFSGDSFNDSCSKSHPKVCHKAISRSLSRTAFRGQHQTVNCILVSRQLKMHPALALGFFVTFCTKMV